MVVSLRLSEQENELIKSVAKLYGVTASELIRKAIMDKIEDEMDIRAYEASKAEYEKNPVVYSFDEVNKMLGISDDV